jgi:hypothetical protein
MKASHSFPKSSPFFSLEPISLILEPQLQNPVSSGMSSYTSGLFLGNYEGATDLNILKRHGIGAVLTVAVNLGISYGKDAGIAHEVIPALDLPNYNLSRFFNKCHEFIDKYRATTNVFVHCMAGISRSATIIITYIMKLYDWDYNKSFEFVRKKRRIIDPNSGFVRQMRNFETSLKISKSDRKKTPPSSSIPMKAGALSLGYDPEVIKKFDFSSSAKKPLPTKIPTSSGALRSSSMGRYITKSFYILKFLPEFLLFFLHF